MSSFLINKKAKKTFEDKISKLAEKTRNNIYAANKSFDRFCLDFYDKRTSQHTLSYLQQCLNQCTSNGLKIYE